MGFEVKKNQEKKRNKNNSWFAVCETANNNQRYYVSLQENIGLFRVSDCNMCNACNAKDFGIQHTREQRMAKLKYIYFLILYVG